MPQEEPLTQRDRLMIAAALRAFVARDIKRRDIYDTYDPAAMTVPAFDLIEFADEMLCCHDGDNVEMMRSVAHELERAAAGAWLDQDDRAQDIWAAREPTEDDQVLARMDDASRLGIDERRRAWS